MFKILRAVKAVKAMKAVRRFLWYLIGIGDYGEYLAQNHRQTPMTYAEFFRYREEARFRRDKKKGCC